MAKCFLRSLASHSICRMRDRHKHPTYAIMYGFKTALPVSSHQDVSLNEPNGLTKTKIFVGGAGHTVLIRLTERDIIRAWEAALAHSIPNKSERRIASLSAAKSCSSR